MPYPRGNSAIALHLLSKFRGLIESISLKMGVRYRLSVQDREDLINAAHAKISTTKWRTVLHRGGNKPLENYTIAMIITTMSKELRRIKAGGLSGLSKGPKIGEFPQHESDTQRTSILLPLRKTVATWPTILEKMAAEELATRAQRGLTVEQWSVVRLAFGFDGGPSRTSVEVAKELDYTISQVECLLEESLKHLRRSLR